MSTENINISRKNVMGKCDLKCAYNFNYPETNLTANNQGVMINLTCDNNNTSPVTYNNQKYNVGNISITCPSIHIFNGSQASAEIVIEHTSVTGGPTLYVGIPISASSESSTASNLITEIIQSVSTNAPAQSEKTNISINGFTLQNIVPSKPFYSYTDNGKNVWIMYGILYAIPLNSSTLTTLSQVIKPFPLPMIGGPLFFNSSGPNTGTSLGDGIYISCKPTGSSEEETGVEYAKNSPTYNLSNLLESPTVQIIFQVLIGCIVFIIVFLVFSYIYSFITKGSVKIPSVISSQS
jgi:hypothetical protein